MITFSAMEEIRWGIVGPGKIAAHFAHDLQLVDDAVLAAVASRNRKRADGFAKEFGIKEVFDSYDELFQSEKVDVVYIATPHVFHNDLTLRALDHGKHVLCEKPLGVNGHEVMEMMSVAKKKGVFLMEALWSRFHPTLQHVKKSVDQGVLGPIRYINADFAFYAMDRDKNSRLLNPELAGGSLLDIGIYPVFLSYLLLGMPKTIIATAELMNNGLETQVSILMDYEHSKSVLYSGFNHNSRMSAEIAGEKGNIYLDPRWHEANGYELVKDGETKRFDFPKVGKGYTHEIEEVHRCLRNGQVESTLWGHQNSSDLVALLDKIRQIAGIHFPFEQ